MTESQLPKTHNLAKKTLEPHSLEAHKRFMQEALAQAKIGLAEGGVPVGAIMVEHGNIIGRGRNRRVQESNPVSHGETDCMKNAGRRPSYENVTMYTTLSPCMMCTGTILQFGISRVVIGECENFAGNIPFLREQGVEVILLEDPDCTQMMSRFIAEKPQLWFEDIAETEQPACADGCNAESAT